MSKERSGSGSDKGMSQKDFVSIYLDVFKYGFVVLVALIGWFWGSSVRDTLDWPVDHNQLSPGGILSESFF